MENFTVIISRHFVFTTTFLKIWLDAWLDHLPPFFHDALIAMYSYILHLLVSVGCIWIVQFLILVI